MSKVLNTIKKAAETGDRRLARQVRIAALQSYAADESEGILNNTNRNVMEFPTRKHQTVERGGKIQTEPKQHKKSDPEIREPARSLSTRYSPDRVGVQVKRISDGVYQDPYTNRIYDWNEGFTTESGETYPGGHVSLQTDLE